MKRLFTVALLCLAGAGVQGQQDAQFTQNMFNRLSVNPGYAGSGEALCGVLLGRQQWMGYDGAPSTYLLSVDMPIYSIKSGVGLNVIQDDLGFETNTHINASYAYRMPLNIVPGGKLGIGVNVGLLNKRLGGAWRTPDTDYFQDPSIPNSEMSDMAFDLGFGVYYQAPQLYVGISSTHLPASTLSGIGEPGSNGYDLRRHYYLMAGYKHQVSGTPFAVLPSIFVKSDASSAQVDLNVNAMFDNKVWAGVTYRIQDAAAILAGFQHDLGPKTGVLKAGLAYDITTNKLASGGSRGSAELMVGFCYPLGSEPKPQRHRSVRTLGGSTIR